MSLNAKVITVRLDPSTGLFDDAELVTFTAGHEVVSVQNHLLTTEHSAHLAFIVLHRGPLGGSPFRGTATVPADKGKDRVDWRASLGDAERGLFDVLRTWRNERAERLGKPAWLIFTNEQLAEIARRRPATLAALGEVPGLGEGRLREFGAELLAFILSVSPASGVVVVADHGAPPEVEPPPTGTTPT